MLLGQQIASGLAAGSVYGLAAIGLVLIYKTSHVVNFAQGEMAMLTTFVAFSVLTGLHAPFAFAFVIAVAFAALLGMLVERLLLRPIADAPVLSLIIVTLGLGSILYAVAGWIWNYDTKTFPPPVAGPPLRVGEIVFAQINLLIFAVSLVLMLLLWAFFRFSDWGLAMRAAVQNRTAARLMGVSPGRVAALTWALSASIGGVAGMLIAPITFLDPNMMSEVILKAFAAAVLGGFTSLPGAVVGGLAIGVLDNLVAAQFGTELKATAAFVVLVAVLAIRPTGLFGERG